MNDASTNDIIDPATNNVLPSVLTFEQAYQTYKNFVTDNRERNAKNAAIARKLNGEQPWNPRKLKAAGQSWRSNRPTGFMSSLMKRLAPPYKQVIDQLPLLTYSKFSDESLGSETHQDIFRQGITDCIRHWEGWSDFLSQLIEEDIGFGYAAVGREDEFSWKPKMYRSDEAMFYVGCPQDSAKVKIWGLKEDFFVDDIVEKLRNPQAAQDAGWNVKNLVRKLNTAGRQFDDRGNQENERVYEDLIRENNLASSFTSSIRVVKAGHIFATNPEGGIDHYIFDRDDGTALFFRRARYLNMEQCLTLFTAEVGDRTLHGSRGAGRALYNTHVSVEQARNLINDALHLSGLLIMRKTTKAGAGGTEGAGLTVNHPFAIVGDGYEVMEKVKFEVNSEAFFALDRHATSQAEIQVGAFMPGQMVDEQGARRTASEVNYVASIDAQIRAGVLARFADQMFGLINQLQRRICSPETVQFASDTFMMLNATGKKPIYDPVAWLSLANSGAEEGFVYIDVPKFIEVDSLKCVIGMLEKGLTTAQIVLLANTTSRSSVDDAIASQSGVLDLIVQRYGMDPMVDTVELKRRDLSNKIGAAGAERLLNVDLNPLSPIKQQRQQLQELTTMLTGTSIPVDPTDDDKIHLSVIADRISGMAQTPEILPMESSRQFLLVVLEHVDAHIQSATQKNIDLKDIQDVLQVFEMARKLVEQPAIDQQAAQMVGQITAEGGVPATELAVDASAPVANPQQTINQVANPPIPTPPKPKDLAAIQLAPPPAQT